MVAGMASASAAVLPSLAAGAALVLVLAAALLWAEIEGPAPIGQALGGRSSQSVVGVRAAASSEREPRWRVVLTAPLDSVPQLPPRRILLALLQIAGMEAILLAAFLVTELAALRWAIAAGSAILLAVVAGMLRGRRRRGPQPAILGAGELATLIAVAEELGELQQVELWTVALGAGSAGDAGVRDLLERYPFGFDTCFINLHHMTTGQPVFVTREGLLRERRSDRRLLVVASEADAADVTINAEPRQLRARTLATLLFRRGYRTITISSHADGHGPPQPDPQTLERCVKLVVGMIRELDQEENVR
jgi:hypothetical protein